MTGAPWEVSTAPRDSSRHDQVRTRSQRARRSARRPRQNKWEQFGKKCTALLGQSLGVCVTCWGLSPILRLGPTPGSDHHLALPWPGNGHDPRLEICRGQGARALGKVRQRDPGRHGARVRSPGQAQPAGVSCVCPGKSAGAGDGMRDEGGVSVRKRKERQKTGK